MDDGAAYDRLIDALRAAGKTVRHTSDTKAMAQCPAHPDRNLSLRLAVGQARCWCIATPDVTPKPMCLPALSLTWADLFDTRGGIKYIYPSGRIAYRTPDKDFKQNGNKQDRRLFDADAIGNATTVYVTEGEQDALAMESVYGVAVVSPPMGANAAAHRWDWTPLAGKDVIVIADRDEAGQGHAKMLQQPLFPPPSRYRLPSQLWARTLKTISERVSPWTS